ncbi:MAG TPA: BlaI/MecI/CopY family transcriptional regulator [Candidatus Baltobacteraceae bacterium]|jgi:BlaI family penicillinase repressor|nr:BlaI/MecI/CopY family transcriptional regulator [Candidatus Baltobacteraceae bacterium]
MKSVRISESEWQVMSMVWDRSPIAASDIVETLSRRTGWHSRTIRTLLDRLVKKGALKATLEGKRYLYEPLLSMEACVRQESRSFLQRVFAGEPAPMILYLVKESKLSSEEIKELKRLLTRKEK